MVLTKPLGVVTYLILLFVLTVFFSYIFVNPGDITEQFLKSGDSLLNIHAGKDTKRYLRRKVVEISLVSAVVMCAAFSADSGRIAGQCFGNAALVHDDACRRRLQYVP